MLGRNAIRFISASLLFVLYSFAVIAQTAQPPINKSKEGVAVKGYDVVAYFTQFKAIKGEKQFMAEWNGVQWFFSNPQHRDTFLAAPEKYLPQYGGYCAWGVGAKNYKADTDPTAWKIVDGKLYLNYNDKVQQLWLKEQPALIQQADKNWKTLREK